MPTTTKIPTKCPTHRRTRGGGAVCCISVCVDCGAQIGGLGTPDRLCLDCARKSGCCVVCGERVPEAQGRPEFHPKFDSDGLGDMPPVSIDLGLQRLRVHSQSAELAHRLIALLEQGHEIRYKLTMGRIMGCRVAAEGWHCVFLNKTTMPLEQCDITDFCMVTEIEE